MAGGAAMTPVEPREHIEGQRKAFLGPAGSGIEPLPSVIIQEAWGPEIRTEWELTFDERRGILDGARVVLTFVGRMPPCRIEIEGVSS